MGRRSHKKKKKNTSTSLGITTTTITSSSPHYPLFDISRCTSTDINISSSSSNDNDWLVFEILNRLPVKSLTRFKSLCKRWCYLIERDQQFIDLHFTRSKTRLPSRLLIVVPLPRTQIQEETLKRIQDTTNIDLWPFKEFHLTADLLFEKDDTKLKLVVDTVREMDSESYSVISKSVNGLVCLIDSFMSRAVCIRNISTGEISPWFQSSSIVVGEERLSFPNLYAFGFDPPTNEHKLVLGDYLNFKDIIQLFEVDGYLSMVVKLNNCTFNMYIYEDDYYMDEDEKFSGTSTTSSLKNGRWSEVSCITLPFYMMNNHKDVKFHTFIGSDDKILVTSSTLGMEEKKRLSIYCYNWKKGTWIEVDVSGIPFSVPQLGLLCFSTTFSESLLPCNNQSAL